MANSDRVVDLQRWRAKGEAAKGVSGPERGDDEVDDGADIRVQIADLQALDAVAVVVATEYYDPDIDAEVVTALRFQACTGACADDDGYGIAGPFVGAADYLIAHPEVSVVATHWHTRPCNSGEQHLILEVTVRVHEPAP
jgi:hypothetical protein